METTMFIDTVHHLGFIVYGMNIFQAMTQPRFQEMRSVSRLSDDGVQV
jgi:hypothetical protein